MTNVFCKSRFQIIGCSDTGEGSELSTKGRGCQGDHRSLRLICEKTVGRKWKKKRSQTPARLQEDYPGWATAASLEESGASQKWLDSRTPW